MILFDGKKCAKEILKGVKCQGLNLAIILVGDDPASELFVKRKLSVCKEMGIGFNLYRFEEKIEQTLLKEEIVKISRDEKNNGVVIQLPLPFKLRIFTKDILNLLPKEKDIDMLSYNNMCKFYQGDINFIPPVSRAILHFLSYYNIPLKGKNVVIVGSGRLVGIPLSLALIREKATVSIINEYSTKDLLKKADIVISGVGKPEIIKGEDLKDGVVVIDAGTSFREGKIIGDIHFESVSKKASYITPLYGGVGPLTIAFLIKNLNG